MLDDLALPQVQEITTSDRRRLVEHRAPGMDGSLLQNLGREPLRVVLHGVATGPDARTFVETLGEKLRAAVPVPFIADIVTDAQLERVAIEDVRVREVAGSPDLIAYTIALVEQPPPPPPTDTPALDAGLLDEANGLVEGLVGGLAGAAAFAESLASASAGLGDLMRRLQEFHDSVDENRP
jgi:hypothetical protein